MSEHIYQSETAAEQQFEETLEAPAAVNSEAGTPGKGRSRVGPVVLEVLQQAKKALTPQQVNEQLPEFSEQQINAAIQNLYKKGAGKLERVRQGRSFAYSAKSEKVRQKRKERVAAPAKTPQELLTAEARAQEGPLTPEQAQSRSPVQVQERQPLNVTVSMGGQFIISKDGQTISLGAEERERFFSFVRKFLS